MQERAFLIVLALSFITVGLTYDKPGIARWVGFLLAGYSAVANDSIQTIGTFISSNVKQKWWVLWLFIGGLFVATMTVSWVLFDGDVSFQRLANKGFDVAPTHFDFLQVAAPIFLMILTRLRMPVSTTFLLLTSFATVPSGVSPVITKSLVGYGLAFVASIVVWTVLSKSFERWFTGEAHKIWMPLQWVTSGTLWVVWLIQDAANIAVYLPRKLGVAEFCVFVGAIFLGLGLLFLQRGERIQKVVDEKSGTVDVRSATMIDLVYSVLLLFFSVVDSIPMSTTWVFIGLLGGRELAMAFRKAGKNDVGTAVRILGKDILFAGIGLVISLIIAVAVNETLRLSLLGW